MMSKRPYNTVVLICIFPEYMAGSYPNEQFYDCVMSPDLEKLSKSLENFGRSQSAINPTFAFWLMYIKMVQILLLFIRATRENNLELHLSAVRLMLPWLIEYIMQDMGQCTGWKCLVWKTRIQVKCY